MVQDFSPQTPSVEHHRIARHVRAEVDVRNQGSTNPYERVANITFTVT